MAFDECVENPASYDYVRDSCARTARWLARCKAENARLKRTGYIVQVQSNSSISIIRPSG